MRESLGLLFGLGLYVQQRRNNEKRTKAEENSEVKLKSKKNFGVKSNLVDYI